jgi:hypothetical protein
VTTGCGNIVIITALAVALIVIIEAAAAVVGQLNVRQKFLDNFWEAQHGLVPPALPLLFLSCFWASEIEKDKAIFFFVLLRHQIEVSEEAKKLV